MKRNLVNSSRVHSLKRLFQPTSWKRLLFFLFFDALLLSLSLYLAFLFHFDFNFKISYYDLIDDVLPAFLIIQMVILAIFKIYKITWRYVGLFDLFNLFNAFVLSTFIIMMLAIAPVNTPLAGFSKRIILADGVISLFFIAALRVSKRFYNEILKNKNPQRRDGKRTLIVGAGNAGEMIVRDMARFHGSDFHPVAFLDDDPNKIGTYIHGIRVENSTDHLVGVAQSKEIQSLIIAIPSLDHKKLRKLYEAAKQAAVEEVKVIPRIYNFQRPEISIRALEDISIEDLIGRQSVTVDAANIGRLIQGKRVLVTGAAGSIGSEIVIQVCSHQPAEMILFDIDETDLHNLGIRLKRRFPLYENSIRYLTGDIRDESRVDEVIAELKPQILFHAAAYKHVPMMEWNASEAVKVNVFGTYNVARCAIRNEVEQCVMISTDKAVRPTSVMGATKRIAEHVCQALGASDGPGRTEFISVRFGNVLGSRGSVLPMFLDQLKYGEALKVTHKEMKRYFMTIPEAVSLVLQAAIIGKGGQVMVLDMGNPVYIKDFAEELIRLHGLEPYRDIDITFTGMRPGEKLFEEILTAEEGTEASKHEKIFISRNANGYNREDIEVMLGEFRKALNDGALVRDKAIRALLKKYVKHYEGTEEIEGKSIQSVPNK